MPGPTVTTAASQLRASVIGAFVLVKGLDLGRARIVDVSPDEKMMCLVWFDSPANPEVQVLQLPTQAVTPAPLEAQRRVYRIDPDTGEWQVGRIDQSGELPGENFGETQPLYWVAFPNGGLQRVRRSELRVRWDRPISDPVALLATHNTATPFWHSGRTRLMRALMEQRAACGGLTGLLSSSVDIEPHQHRVVHQVLNDPIQRYLLADEVGLGKTIEAGAILRQMLLEDDEATALVIVPSHLEAQWRDELETRFHLGPLLGGPVQLAQLERLQPTTSPPAMLIVDEAHHPAALAHSPIQQERDRFGILAELARRSPRVLLLSATPVLRNEAGFLAMLHLLDPAAYPLDDLTGFRERVSQRQAIAEHLADLADDAQAMFMEDALDGLEELLGEDGRVLELVRQVRPLVDEEENHPGRMAALAALRTHVGELYRLHRRLLRNRRVNIEGILRPRGGLTRIPLPPTDWDNIYSALEEWRGDALVAAARDAEVRRQALHLWEVLLRAALSGPQRLHAIAVRRLEGMTARWSSSPKKGTAEDPVECGELFSGERERVADLLAAIELYEDPRCSTLASWLADGDSERVVIFLGAADEADAVYAHLVGPLGERVWRHRGQQDVQAFLNSDDALALICDRTAEEGLNLQGSRAGIFHYDLPLSPNRIEQRIGRIDRYGARQPARSFAFASSKPYLGAWLDCLDSDIRVFSRSVASLQYALNDHLKNLLEGSFELGVEAFRQFSQALQDEGSGLDSELDKIRHQENLDALEADSTLDERFFELDDIDQDHERLEQDLESWLVGRLQMERRDEDKLGRYRRYRYLTGDHQRKRVRQTLVPLDDWLRFFGSSLDNKATREFIATPVMTWSRNQAARKRLPPIRLGNPLFDGAWAHAEHDDRGVAFCMWRHRVDFGRSEPFLAFRFDFIIEAHPDPIRDWLADHPGLSEAAVRRQLDAVFTPIFVTIYVDDQLQKVRAPELLDLLGQDYSNRGDDHGRDINLRSDRWVEVATDVYPGDWAALCADAAQVATRLAREETALGEQTTQALERLERSWAERSAQRQARIQCLSGPAKTAEHETFLLEEDLHGRMKIAVSEPYIRPDSAGAIVLAGSNPFTGCERD